MINRNIMKRLKQGLKILTLTFVLLICFMIAGMLVNVGGETSGDPVTSLLALLVLCFVDSLVLAYMIIHSRWSGLKLTATVFFVFYGIATFMTLIEAVFFDVSIPRGELINLFIMNALVIGMFSPLAVLILGKMKKEPLTEEENLRLIMPAQEWILKFAMIIVFYVFIYLTFGYFILWQSASLREFYQIVDLSGYFSHTFSVLTSSTKLIFFQMFRAVIWVILALPVIRMMKGEMYKTGFTVGLLFAVLMCAQLLLPNPYMPFAVRMAHFVETVPSNFIFGWLVVWLFNRHHRLWNDLIKSFSLKNEF